MNVFWDEATLQIFKALQVNYRKMMVDYSLVAHQRIVGFSCYSYMKLQVCTVICYCHYHQTIRVQLDQCRMPLLNNTSKIYCSVRETNFLLDLFQVRLQPSSWCNWLPFCALYCYFKYTTNVYRCKSINAAQILQSHVLQK